MGDSEADETRYGALDPIPDDDAVVIPPGSVWGKHGEKIATKAMRAVHALQAADWISPDVENEDLSDACMIIADAFASET
jgi:hypothetical protein